MTETEKVGEGRKQSKLLSSINERRSTWPGVSKESLKTGQWMRGLPNQFLLLKNIFLMWTIFKVFIDLLQYCFFFFLMCWCCGREPWDLSCLTRNQICAPALREQSPNHSTTRETPVSTFHLGCTPAPVTSYPAVFSGPCAVLKGLTATIPGNSDGTPLSTLQPLSLGEEIEAQRDSQPHSMTHWRECVKERVKIRLFASWTWARAPTTVAQRFLLSWRLSWSETPSPGPSTDSCGTRDRRLSHVCLSHQ